MSVTKAIQAAIRRGHVTVEGVSIVDPGLATDRRPVHSDPNQAILVQNDVFAGCDHGDDLDFTVYHEDRLNDCARVSSERENFSSREDYIDIAIACVQCDQPDASGVRLLGDEIGNIVTFCHQFSRRCKIVAIDRTILSCACCLVALEPGYSDERLVFSGHQKPTAWRNHCI